MTTSEHPTYLTWPLGGGEKRREKEGKRNIRGYREKEKYFGREIGYDLKRRRNEEQREKGTNQKEKEG